MKKYTSKILSLLPILIFLGAFYFISPEQIVSAVGVENSYIFMFLIALIGGLSMFSGVPYVAILVTFALGGLDPIILGLSAAIGVIVGDSSSYIIGKKSSMIITKPIEYLLNKLFMIYDKYPKYLPLLFLLYGTFIPFPNDVITLSAGVKGYSFWKTVIPLGIGNIVFCTTVAYYSEYFSHIF